MGRILAEAAVEEGALSLLPKCESIIRQLHTLGELEAWPWMILGGVGLSLELHTVQQPS